MENNLKNRIYEIGSHVSGISSEVTSALEKEASMIAFSQYTLENPNIEERTVDLVCELLPKEYSATETEVSLVYENKEYPLEFKDGTFNGRIPVSIFETSNVIESVIMRDGDTVRTEGIEWYVSPRYDFVPLVYADLGTSSSWHKTEDGIMWEVTGDANVWIDQKGGGSIPDEAYFCVKVDDKIIDKKDISNQSHFNIEDEYLIPLGSELTLYVEVTDEFGMHHRPILERVMATEDGALVYDEEEYIWRGAAGDIYDENGNLLFSEYENYE